MLSQELFFIAAYFLPALDNVRSLVQKELNEKNPSGSSLICETHGGRFTEMGEQEQVVISLILLFTARQLNALGDASTSVIGGLFIGETSNATNLAVCFLEAGTLRPKCSRGASPVLNYTVVPFYNQTRVPDLPLLGIAAGSNFFCGLSYDSLVPLCWGAPEDSAVPSQYQTVPYASLTVGAFHVCGLRVGSLVVDCWGQNTSFASELLEQSIVSLASGDGFTCGLTGTGQAKCWGYRNSTSQPPNVLFKAIYAGVYHACGIERDTGHAFCWGGDPYRESSNMLNYTFTSMALGRLHSCGILKDSQKALCWGSDELVQDTPSNETFSSISAGDYYTCGVSLQPPKHLKCWGGLLIRELGTKVSQGVCTSSACTSSQYQLPDHTGNFYAQCPRKGDRICLECPSAGCPTDAGSKTNSTAPRTLTILVSLLASVLVFITGFTVCCKNCPTRTCTSIVEEDHEMNRTMEEPHRKRVDHVCSSLIVFDSMKLRLATNNYASQILIGSGSSAPVYKATLTDGTTFFAIKKKLNSEETFSKEVEWLSSVQHTFLTNLVGFCKEEKLLVYDFMDNGSLSDCLFDKPGLELNFAMRIRIAVQTARALEYLHHHQIIHGDVKSSNILLDKDWNAHISNFNLSAIKAVPEDTNASVGSPDEPALNQLTTSCDLYNFGVVLLELLCGRRAIHCQHPLVTWVMDAIKSSEMVFDKRLVHSSHSSAITLVKMLDLAIECTKTEPRDRPAMTSVASRLETLLSGDEVPMASWFFPQACLSSGLEFPGRHSI